MAESDIANDEVVINYRIEQESKDAKSVRQYVNRVSGLIQKRLKDVDGVTLKTTGRNMQPVWQHRPNKPRERTGWRMTQTGQVISKKLDAVPDWLAAIEDAGAHLSGLQFRISAATSQEVQGRLLLQAIAIFREKASVIASGIGASSFKVIRLNTASQTPRSPMYASDMPMMARSMKSAAAPALSAGKSLVKINISGEIETPFVDFPAP